MFSQLRKFKTMRALWMIPGLAVLAPVGAAELNGQARGFLLHTPQITVVVRGGYSVPRLGGGGDTESLWDFTKQHLTVGNRDFAGSHVMVEVGIRGSERVDLVLALGHSPTSVLSEFRELEGDDGLPITQTTDFTTTPLTAGIRLDDAGVATAVIDMVVELSFPEHFALNEETDGADTYRRYGHGNRHHHGFWQPGPTVVSRKYLDIDLVIWYRFPHPPERGRDPCPGDVR